MTCSTYSSSVDVSIFYAVDTHPLMAVSQTQVWSEVPFTSDSLAANLSSSQSERIATARAYTGSSITSAEVSGSLGFETEANTFLNTMIQAALQSPSAPTASAAKNGSTPKCLMFCKRVKRGAGFEYYVFRGVQVDSLSLSLSPGSLITGDLALQGMRVGAGVLGATDVLNDVFMEAPAGWTFTNYTSGAFMSSVFAVKTLQVQNSSGTNLGIISRELSLTLSNQLRQQQAIGSGTPFSAGVASGRFRVTASLEAYYSGPNVIDAMYKDQELKLLVEIVDSEGKGWEFLLDRCKILSCPPPNAESADQDIVLSIELMGFETEGNGSISISRVGSQSTTVEFATANSRYFLTADGNYFGTSL